MDVYELAKQAAPEHDYGDYRKQVAGGEGFSVKVNGETIRLKKYTQDGRTVYLGISHEQKLLIFRRGARLK